MTDPKVLRHFGTTNDALRAFFTCDRKPDADPRMVEAKKRFTDWIRNILLEGRRQSVRYYRFYAAADLMWDSTPILPEAVPLMAYAQGKIDFAVCEKELGPAASKFIEEVPLAKAGEAPASAPGAPQEVKKVLSLQKLQEVVVNIGRSYITRRVDAQCNQYNNLRPQFKYDPRDGSLVGRCRADAMSEYSDIMSESYGYPHIQRQAIRDMLMYGRSLMFPECAWDRDTVPEFAAEGEEGAEEVAGVDAKGNAVKRRMKTRVVREGVPMVNIHPSKVLYDASQPLATINTDTGCRYIGYWDVRRFSDIKTNPLFFNTDRVAFSSGSGSFYANHRAYFDILYGDQPINFPTCPSTTVADAASPDGASTTPVPVAGGRVDMAAQNDRTANTTFYDDTHGDRSVFVSSLRIKVTPSDWFGMGGYSRPVWLHLHVAGDDTVIFGEWMPSLPAIYWGHNENDAKMVNLGQMHEIMPWQDQLTNIFSQLLMVMKRTLAQIIVVNTDVVNDQAGANSLAKLRADLQGDNFYVSPKLLEVSFAKLKKLNLDIDAVVKIVQPNAVDSEYIVNAFKAISQILMILERLMMMSPQEQGQAAKHELSATESAVIQNTTQVKFEAIAESVNEARSAWKRLIFESGQAFGSEQVELWVTQRYPEKVVKEAGFKLATSSAEGEDKAVQQKGLTLLGTKRALVHNYTFTSRDGANRFTDQQAANTLVQAMGTLLPLVGAQAVGKERIFMVFNSVLRLLGLPTDLLLRIEPGEDMRVGEEAARPEGAEAAAEQQRLAAIEQALQALVGSQGQFAEQVRQLAATMQQVLGQAAPAPAAPALAPAA